MRTKTKNEGKGGGKHARPRFPASSSLRPPPYHRSRRLPPFPVSGQRKHPFPSAAGPPPRQRRSWFFRQLYHQQQQYQQEGRRRRPWSGAADGHVPSPQRLSCFVGDAVCGRSCACWYGATMEPLLLVACLLLGWGRAFYAPACVGTCVVSMCARSEGWREGREGMEEGRGGREAVHPPLLPRPYSRGLVSLAPTQFHPCHPR